MSELEEKQIRFERVYGIIQKPRLEKKNLDGIKLRTTIRGQKSYARIIVKRWNNWDSSLWVKLVQGQHEVIFDSGVIEELAAEIKRLKVEAEKS